jgi:hypothetical protein
MVRVFKPKGSSKYIILYFDENGNRRKKVGTTESGYGADRPRAGEPDRIAPGGRG